MERSTRRFAIAFSFAAMISTAVWSQSAVEKKLTWKPVPFAIVRYNDEAPASWNIYHTEKRGVLLVHLWKRYLLIEIADEEVYDIDPQKVKPQGENVEWAYSDQPEQVGWHGRGCII